MNAPLSLNEQERLKALDNYAILDTPPEAAFDRLTRLASRLFNVPIALISLIDRERQWFKACYGLDMRQTDRQLSFCAHAILADHVMVVPDAHEDARFADNGLVTGPPHIRFYAGAPLRTPDGFNLGTFCIIDTVPRELRESEAASLVDLAAMAVDEFELRRAATQLRATNSDLQRMSTALRESQELFNCFMDNSPVVAFMKDEAGRFQYVNQPLERRFDVQLADLQGKTDFDWLPEATAQQVRENDLTVLNTDSTLETLETVPTPDGTPRCWLSFKFPVQSLTGQRYVGGVALDITERRRVEEALRESEERYRMLIEHASDLIYQTDASGHFTFFNPTVVRLLQYSEEELLGMKYLDLIAPTYRQAVGDFYRHQAAMMIPDTYNEFPAVAKDGGWIWFGQNAHLVIDQDQIIRFEAVARDITARKRAEEALQESEDRFRLLVASIQDYAILRLDTAGHIVSWNTGAQRIIGYQADEIIGQHFVRFYPPEDIVAGKPELELKVAALQGRFEDTGWHVRKDGSRFLANVVVTPLHDEAGQLRGFSKVSRDITASKRAEEALQQAKAEAERANLAKSEFLSRMSHELRTPLNAVLGFGQLLQLDDLTTSQRRSVDLILKGGRHLLDLINEVLDIARIEAGRLPLSPEPVALHDALLETLDLVRPLAAQRQIALAQLGADHPDSCRRYVLADRQRFKQVILNLLSNAIKYNRDGGSVTLGCVTVKDRRLRITVQDTGPGIPPHKLERLFVPFDRLDAEQTRIEGTGLGLALSQRLIEAMGGAIGVTSTPGEGSTFWVELPVAEDPLTRHEPLNGSEQLPAALSQTTRTVLYIEDNLSNLELIERLLQRRPGIKLLSAMQGRFGLELARDYVPDLILLDLHLPDLTGEEVLLRLQAEERLRAVPVVVISADATPGQIERLLNDGARAYLTKPLDLERFFHVLDETLGQTDDDHQTRSS